MATENHPGSIGPYRVVRVLGRGGFGTVYLAEQSEPVHRHVAVKFLNVGMDTEEVLARFDAERKTLNLMNHPGIAMLLDAGAADSGQPYVVMEYVDGTPLRDYVACNDLSIGDRLRLFREICDAVQHAHQKGVIHRDLSANNVLIVEVDGVPRPKVIDFGVAKSMGDRLTDLTLHTTPGQMIGTPEYMSPEQALGRSNLIDTRTDVYALGVLLYLLLTDTLPFESGVLRSSGLDMLRIITEQEPALPSARVRSFGSDPRTLARARRLRGDLDWICATAMAKDRADRYASVAELSDDVRRHLETEPVSVGPPSAVYRLRKLIRRHRAAFVAIVSTFAAVLVGGIVSFVLYVQAEWYATEADANLSKFEMLADVLLLERLENDVDGLGAALPQNVDAFDAWIGRARTLVARAPAHRDVVRRLGEGATASSSGEPVFEDAAAEFLYRALGRLLVDLEALEAPVTGAIADVNARLDRARVVRYESVDARRDDWERAVREVADGDEYPGVSLREVVGLVPLGADPQSDLQEFAVHGTGEVPIRDAATRALRITPSSAVVLVLVPGGSCLIGAQRESPDLPRYDPDARDEEGREVTIAGTVRREPIELRLDPFFVSKFEVTRAQWRRMSREPDPSSSADPKLSQYGLGPNHPVDSVQIDAARRVLGVFGMDLPTEVQWEYACRAGTDTPWFTGLDPGTLQDHANISDLTASEDAMGKTWANFEGVTVRDGYVLTSPVGAFRPNRFGLHDTHGNLMELCRDFFAPYDPETMRPGDGERLESALTGALWYVIRGGAYRYRASFARASYRWYLTAETASPEVGLRPVMRLPD